MSTRITAADLPAVLEARTTRTNGCWTWNGTRTKAGYGQVRFSRQSMYAHRLSYELHNGPIAPGMHVCHTCDNPPCVNPAHLFLGTPKDNAADMVRKGRARNGGHRGAQHGMAKLTESQVIEIRRRAAAGENQHAIARDFGVTNTAVSMIHNRRVWTHV